MPDLKTSLMRSISTDPKELQEIKDEVTAAGTDTAGSLDKQTMHKQIWCTEIEASSHDLLFRSGKFPYSEKEYCDAHYSFNVYDSEKWQNPSPIFYLQGEDDPAVPLENAWYHFIHQKNNKRVFLIAPQTAHPAIGFFIPCKDGLWKSIMAGGSQLAEALRACPLKPKVYFSYGRRVQVNSSMF